jgi:DnaJ-class molecular chaperone
MTNPACENTPSKPPLPAWVRECRACKGAGQYPQLYNAGCGMGLYRSMGPCGCCKGTGYLYLTGDPVPSSVVNQIEQARRQTL